MLNKMRKIIYILILLIISNIPSFAVFDVNQFNQSTKEIRRIDNFGTEFYITVPPAFLKENLSNVSIKLFVFSYFDTKVTIKSDAKSYSESAPLTANTEALFDLLPEIVFPFNSTTSLPQSFEEIYKKSALKITSDFPVSVYVLVTGDAQSEGFLALPVRSLGKEYILKSYIDPSSEIPSTIFYPAIAGIVNPFDGNQIKIILSNKLKGNVFLSDTIVRVLDAGDTWFLSLKGKAGDLSGIQVVSDKPISVITANQLATVPIGIQPQNYLVEMEMPANTWGYIYHIPRLYTRPNNPIIRIYAKNPDSEIYLNNQKITTLISSENPDNYIEIRPDVVNPVGVDVVSSNKPISISIFNAGYTEQSNNLDIYKPFRINLIPFEQYENALLFNVSQSIIDILKSDVILVIISEVSDDGTIPNTFEIGYTEKDKTVTWSKLNSMQIQDIKEYKYLFNGKKFIQITLKLKKAGNYQLRNDKIFATYLIGSNSQGTFAFPAGTLLRTLASKDKLPPDVKYIQGCDGSVFGSTTDKPDNTEERSNLTTPIFYSNLSYNYDKIIDNIVPGVTSTINWRLTVRNKNLDAKAIITFMDYAGNDTTLAFEYFAPKISVEPPIVDFGNTLLGVETIKTITIKNNSDSTIHLKEIAFKYPETGFKLKEPFYEAIINPHSSITLDIAFTPQKSGQFEDSLGINNNCFTSFKIKLLAHSGKPKIHTTDINFGEVVVSAQETKTSTITNIGDNTLKITGWKLSDNVNFSVDFKKDVSAQNPLILQPNETYTFNVTFLPTTDKKFQESVIITSDAEQVDSIAILIAKSIKPGLLVKVNNWEKVRLDNSPSPKQYSNSNAIIVQNTGSVNLSITNAFIDLQSVNPANFIIDLQSINGKTIKPKESISIPCTFLPRNLGENSLIVHIETNLNTNSNAILTGFVVIPKLKDYVSPIDFDTTLVNYPNSENNKLMEIQNLSIADWQYADTITIKDIIPLDPGVVFNNEHKTGSFLLNTDNANFPIKLMPGEKINIPITFAAKDSGLIQARIMIETDGISDYIVTLKGYGIDRSLTISENNIIETCINTPKQINCLLKNSSQTAIKIEKVSLNSEDSDFSLIEDYSQGFTLQPMESKQLKVQYLPTNFSVKTATLSVKVLGDEVPSLIAKIKGVTNYKLLPSYLSPVSQTAKINTDIKVKVIINEIPSLENYSVSKYKVNIKYDGNFLKLLADSISAGKTTLGKFEIANLKINSFKGTAEFDFKNLNGAKPIEYGEFLNLTFHVYNPTNGASSSNIEVTLIPENETCFAFQTTSSYVVLMPVCGGDIAKIELQNENYYLEGIEPSPLNQSKEIKFGIAFDGFTLLAIFNQYGVLCLNPINQFLKKGDYSYNLDLENLASGVYFIVFKSGEINITKKFIIAK